MDIIRIVSLDNVKTAGEFAGAIEFTVTPDNCNSAIKEYTAKFISSGFRNFFVVLSCKKVTFYFSVQNFVTTSHINFYIHELEKAGYSPNDIFKISNERFEPCASFFDKLVSEDIKPNFDFEIYKYRNYKEFNTFGKSIHLNTVKGLTELFNDMEHNGCKLIAIINISDIFKKESLDKNIESINGDFIDLIDREIPSNDNIVYRLVMTHDYLRAFVFVKLDKDKTTIPKAYYDLDYLKTKLMFKTEFHLLGIVANTERNIKLLSEIKTTFPTKPFFKLRLVTPFGDDVYEYCNKKYAALVSDKTKLSMYRYDNGPDSNENLYGVIQINEMIKPYGKQQNHYIEKFFRAIDDTAVLVKPDHQFITLDMNDGNEWKNKISATRVMVGYIIFYFGGCCTKTGESSWRVLTDIISQHPFIAKNRKVIVRPATEHQVRMLLGEDLCEVLPNFLIDNSDIGSRVNTSDEMKEIKKTEGLIYHSEIVERCTCLPRRVSTYCKYEDLWDVDSKLTKVE